MRSGLKAEPAPIQRCSSEMSEVNGGRRASNHSVDGAWRIEPAEVDDGGVARQATAEGVQ